ncbi:MAG: TonB-dependent receptor, partial [Chitinophagaceae bacterium]|nr:TonB-dependent receptor [Rubrivivax sp.]
GREEIDKFGDATLGEVLRRLPGVTTPGAPGRGGAPRMRGLGGGFTQLLIDGQRVAPGFSLESLTPEQVERIEILRAPTAETGARAIAGTINIITREGFKRRLNDLRIGTAYENGQPSYSAGWTHNDNAGPLTYNLSGSAFGNKRENSTRSSTTVTDALTGELLEDRNGSATNLDDRLGLSLTTRLQWRLNESGDMLALMPSVFHTKARSDARFELTQRERRDGITPPFYDFGTARTDSAFTNGRLGAQWRQRLGDVRLELNANGGMFRARNDSKREEFTVSSPTPRVSYDDRSRSEENSGLVNLKASTLLGGRDVEPGSEHTLVAGLEAETVRRSEFRSTSRDGESTLTEFGANLQASSLRLAAYAQDEWNISPNWSAYAGLRWEGITTRGDNAALAASERRPTNRSSVWTPLAHAVWKPDPKGRDQVRMSLTRSYRSPMLASLIARPSINRDFPESGPNRETSADGAGNPNLKPELATGIDVAFERYLEAGGVLSANVFRRNISNLMRSVTTLQNVSYSPFPRYVRRQENIGDAVTQGLELEAKFRLDQVIAGSPGVELRSNLSLYSSRVSSVPGPDNRLDEQAKASGNLGADYRLRGLPLTLGSTLNWVPGYTTRIDADQTITVDRKQIWDAYALWTFTPTLALRVLGNNLDPRGYDTVTVNDTVLVSGTERTTLRSGGPSHVNWQMRLEMKL